STMPHPPVSRVLPQVRVKLRCHLLPRPSRSTLAQLKTARMKVTASRTVCGLARDEKPGILPRPLSAEALVRAPCRSPSVAARPIRYAPPRQRHRCGRPPPSATSFPPYCRVFQQPGWTKRVSACPPHL